MYIERVTKGTHLHHLASEENTTCFEVCSEREIHCLVTACSSLVVVRHSNLDKALVDDKSRTVEQTGLHEQLYGCRYPTAGLRK
jgi:hypothetical protein